MLIKAPAKINLGLTVLARRPDGYHELSSVMQQVSLADTIILEPRSEPGYHFYCSDPLLSGETNLVCRAADLLIEKAGTGLPGVKISLFKQIPVAAGLGGGSSDAAAALKGLNIFWKLGLGTVDLEEAGAQIGSDVPYCLRGGTVLVEGRGEMLTTLPALPFYWVVLALPPGVSVSTERVYGMLDPARFMFPPPEDLIRALRERKEELLWAWFSRGETNSLETAVLLYEPSLKNLKKEFLNLGLWPALSGSGPAYFALTGNIFAAQTAVRALDETGYRAFLCWTVPRSG